MQSKTLNGNSLFFFLNIVLSYLSIMSDNQHAVIGLSNNVSALKSHPCRLGFIIADIVDFVRFPYVAAAIFLGGGGTDDGINGSLIHTLVPNLKKLMKNL